jgi:hypothetical protein
MLVWVMTSLSEESDVSLKLLNLIKVVDEGLRDLFDKEWPIGDLEFHVSLQSFVVLFMDCHVPLGNCF